MIKKIFAWILVILVGYVTIYTYLHPQYVEYYTEEPTDKTADYDPNRPIGSENILMKEKNPFVYYVLKFQWVLVVIGLLWWVLDIKGTKKIYENFLKKYQNMKDNPKFQ